MSSRYWEIHTAQISCQYIGECPLQVSDEGDWGKRMAAEWPDVRETRRNVTKWLKMLRLYDEQTNWLSQVVQWHEGSTGHAQIHEAVGTL